LFDTQDRSWVKKSKFVGNAHAEISFSLAPTYQPEPDCLDEDNAISLPVFKIGNRNPEDIPSMDVVGNEQLLVDHYQAVLRLANEHGHTYREFEHHMWLRLHITCEDDAIGFSWYDTLERMEKLFSWLKDADDGDLWSDVDQGWEVIAIRIGPYVHFRQGGFDQGGEYANLAFPRDNLLKSVSALQKRIGLIIAELSRSIGEDYWSHYRRDLRPDVF